MSGQASNANKRPLKTSLGFHVWQGNLGGFSPPYRSRARTAPGSDLNVGEVRNEDGRKYIAIFASPLLHI